MASTGAGVVDREQVGTAPIIDGRKQAAATVALWVFVLVPFGALAAAEPVAWGWGLRIGLAKGLLFAHVGWMFGRDLTNRRRFAKDLLADAGIGRVDRLFLPLVAASLLLPPAIGLPATGTWLGALTAFFWGALVRIAMLHHVTWSINSSCHVFGERPLKPRAGDRAANFWPLAILSSGESWHNGHHADPTCARHGVLPGQIDISARLIRLLERLGWAHDVRWPTPARLAARRRAPSHARA